jgi:hypothetical protein
VPESLKKPQYEVYVDEVFENFMNYPSLDGYFCYAGLMIPKAKVPDLASFWEALVIRLKRNYYRATGFQIQEEFKSTYLIKLPLDDRLDMCRRIAYFLKKNSGYICGFFTSVHGLLCSEIRNDAGSRDFETLPAYDRSILEVKKDLLKAKKRHSIGESHVLRGLFQTIAGIPLSWMKSIGAQFSICYDSRDKKEDRVLLGNIQDFFPGMKNVDSSYEGVYLGGFGHPDSSEVPGLMLADLIVKEMRNFFLAYPALLSEHSQFNLITPTSKEGKIIPTILAGRQFKWGSFKQMSQGTLTEQEKALLVSPFSTLIPCLADKKASCYAYFGESRVIDFNERGFSDMVD